MNTETFSTRQLAAQAEVKFDRITRREWCEGRVREILDTYSVEVVRKIMVENMKFAGIFTAGHQLVDWCRKAIQYRTKATV